MKKITLLITLSLYTISISAQEMVNFILVGNSGITENIKEATSFIVIKQFPDRFQRLDYNIGSPLQRVRNYADTALKILNGPYYEYSLNGALTLSGTYLDNKKEKNWYHYNDTGKVLLQEEYELGVLKKRINLDTVMQVVKLDINKGDVEAVYKKSDADWREYIMRNLNPDVAEKSIKGGTVRVGFTVNTSGQCVDIYLRRSVEFVLDEEAIRVIEKAPALWTPAVQDGKKVNAFRIQPISFIVE